MWTVRSYHGCSKTAVYSILKRFRETDSLTPPSSIKVLEKYVKDAWKDIPLENYKN